MVTNEDYDHTKTMEEIVKWMKLTHMLLIMSLNLGPPFVHLPLLH